MTRPPFHEVLTADPQVLSGTPVFTGTRVPVTSLFAYLAGGDSLDEFLRQFPSVRREQAAAALALACEALLRRAPSGAPGGKRPTD